jgi:pyrimidine operon attenuation protein/uracil phosphoribosyltransferase
LAALIDRGGRELPIEPNFTGRTVPAEPNDHISVKVNEMDGQDAVVLQKRPEGTGA